MDEFKPSGRELVIIGLWVKQATLLLAFTAALTAMISARYAERSWLISVACAFVALIVSTMVGAVLGRMVLEQAANSRVAIKKSDQGKENE